MRDTTAEAAEAQLAAFRRLSPAERVTLALEASDWLMAVARARPSEGPDLPPSTGARMTAALASAEVPFMLTGSVAAAYHGAPRATMDIDLVIVATLEDVILTKLEWALLGGSRRQLEDVATLLRVRRDEVDRAYVERWVAALGLEREWSEALRQAG